MKSIKKSLLGLLCLCSIGLGCHQTKNTTMNGVTYETAPNDPMKVKIYTLKNGLKVYMSVVKDAPRIQTYIVTRAGSKNDPANATGLAHYLEHMLFKGSSKIGALDWKKEKVLLKKISKLYEKHRIVGPEHRADIYKEIDALSNDAAKLVAANEYDKMISSLGAKGTNAFTSLDRTAYVNNIPSNELEKWLKIESERFNELVLRLFHTELEAVYEEFNISQSSDSRKIFKEFLNALCPEHTYGTQTTIGTGEHLKTPSMVEIHKFFDTYYVPNNMAIVLAGDFDPDKAVQLIEKYWGHFKKKKVADWEIKPQPETTAPTVRKVVGKEKERVQIGWRVAGAGSDQSLLAKLVGGILYNSKAGLMDMNLVQAQKIGGGSYGGTWIVNDFSFLYLYGEPVPDQTLESVKDLLLSELDKIKKGEFEDWMLEAVINNLEYEETQSRERLMGRAYSMMDAFIFDQKWANACNDFKRMRAFKKKDIVDFANQYLKNESCAIVYKREGNDTKVLKVDKPKITPIQVNRDTSSVFRTALELMSSEKQSPVFLDFAKSIEKQPLKKEVNLNYIKNENNETFELEYIFEMGRNSDNLLPSAIKYLPYLGTDKYSAEEIKQEFFKLGLSFDVYADGDVSYVMLRGLDRSFAKGVELLEHIMANAKADEEILKNMMNELKKSRLDEKKDKSIIMRRAMINYGIYGASSPFKNRLQVNDMANVSTNDLLKRIHNLTSYEHNIFYYGSQDIKTIAKVLNEHHHVPNELQPCPAPANFKQLDTKQNKVIFVNFDDMAQAEIMLISKGTPQFDLDEHIMSQLYNQYFGAGLSSVVFQEIRESRALAYSAYTYNSSPSKKNKAHYLRAFVGTQADKMKQAIPALQGIIEDMPISEGQITNAVDAIIKKIESERITKTDIYWTSVDNKKKGFDRDIREDAYLKFKELAKDKKAVVAALKAFHTQKIKGRNYTYLVLGDKSKLDMDYLKSLGEFKELSMKELFGY